MAAGFLVLNGIIGAGIFGLPGKLVNAAGDFSPWLFLIFGFLILAVVLPFASLASYFRSTGGPVVYVTEAFGPTMGFQTGWLFYVGRVAAFGANINLLFDYAAYLFDAAKEGWSRAILILVIIGTLAIINIIGIKKAVQAINILTFLKLVPILLMILLGVQYLTPQHLLPPDLPQFDEMGSIVLFIFFAFTGFESVLASAGETKNPRRNIPRALIAVFLIVMVVYFLLQLVYVAADLDVGEDGTPLVELGILLGGQIGGIILIWTVIFSILGNISGIAVFASRSTFGMANYGVLPKWFGKVHEKYHTPVNSIIFQAVFVAILATTGTFVYLALAGTLARMFAYSICILALPIVKKKADPETVKQAFKVPGGFIIPVVGIGVCILGMTDTTISEWYYLTAFVAIGTALYFLNEFHKKRAAD